VNQASKGSVRILAPFPNLNILSDNTSTNAEEAAGRGRSSDNSLHDVSPILTWCANIRTLLLSHMLPSFQHIDKQLPLLSPYPHL
jgi:hypothetical protein